MRESVKAWTEMHHEIKRRCAEIGVRLVSVEVPRGLDIPEGNRLTVPVIVPGKGLSQVIFRVSDTLFPGDVIRVSFRLERKVHGKTAEFERWFEGPFLKTRPLEWIMYDIRQDALRTGHDMTAIDSGVLARDDSA